MLDKLLKYVECPDYKDLITDDCELIIDTDLLSFAAASSVESRSIIVKSKELDFEKSFKTRTEFRGRSRKDIAGSGSFLDDWNTERKVEGLDELKPSDFQVEDVQTQDVGIEIVQKIFDNSIERIKQHLGITKATLYTKTGGERNFRDALPMPRQYKSQRGEQLKPVFLKQLRQYISNRDDCVDVVEGLEVDDIMSIKCYESHRHLLKTGKHKFIIVCLDKDSLTHPGLQFCFQRDSERFLYPHPLLIQDTSKDIGKLELKKGKVVGYGLKFLAHQLTYGDTSDLYSSYLYLDFPRGTYGEKLSYELLSPCETPQEILEAVKSHYKRLFMEGVKFTNWDGVDLEMSWQDWLSANFQAAYMKRSFDDSMSAEKLFRVFGVDFE